MEGDLPRSLTLGNNVRRQFLPDPYPDAHIPELRDSWRTWIVGNALRELDQFLSLYLDEAYDMVQQAKLVSGENPADHQWKRIDRQTNVADKHKLVVEQTKRGTQVHLDDHQCLVSLSNARNCLAHDLGIVTRKRAIDGELRVRWLAVRMLIEQGDRVIDMDVAQFPIELDPDGPAGVVIGKVEIAEKIFPMAGQIQFTPNELLEICFFYQLVIDRVAQVVQEYAEECGVVFAQIETAKAEAAP
ncbi:hypothetical protein BamMEX5DRAFT_2204 [Burkholderia ambifaria MEX-5]|uniref:Uncharacterized protein n=2 Tax=Burkholderia ambifaria TaxID=152480 RepID=B1T338_9BURK|nr:hypothetical protein BamMEX5DRAFT_2204 [Burkholderia ambifaria MEX-5]